MNFNASYASLCAPAEGVGLDGLRRVLLRLGNPQTRYKIIHIAGTNGKGSVAALLAEALCESGYRTGLFVSPHVLCPTERIQVSGQAVSKPAFVRLIQRVQQAAAPQKLNFFETLTVAALFHFARQKADYAVLETGLGGLKDPTNVCVPVLSLITAIGLDHTAVLGKRLGQIAAQKAGIIKHGVPVLCGALPPSAQKVIAAQARRKQAPLEIISTPLAVQKTDWQKQNLYLQISPAKRAWPLHLLGAAQPLNAALVLAAGERLKLKKSALKRAFARVCVPARFEILRRGKTTFILDGAHNPQAVENLIAFWKNHPAYPRATLLCGCMQDKDYKKIVRLLAPHFERLVFTAPPSPRGLPAEALRRCAPPRAEAVADWRAALKAASTGGCVVCTGSFYLAGAVRRVLCNARARAC